ncbi:Transcriptional regulator, TetR family [Candidatus Magnetomorum sp. HK-1]|nr:Transcriptional regulator, TetR family [Candidatus Magnetomorum sp. HK-1]
MRNRILEQAIRLFGSNGFEGTSIQVIADAVGIKKPSLLYHFNSKAKLRDEVYKHLFDHWKSELPKLLAAASKDPFGSFIKALVEYFQEDPNRSRIAVREMLDRPEFVRKVISEELSPWVKLVSDYIRMGKQSGAVKSDVDPESYIILVIMMVIGTVAVGDVLSAVVVQENSDTGTPLIEELERIGRSALLKHI